MIPEGHQYLFKSVYAFFIVAKCEFTTLRNPINLRFNVIIVGCFKLNEF